ncbi:zinc-binding dehydrogenase [Streptomyces griseoviridis]
MGEAVVQVARMLCATVIGTTSGDALERAKELGVDRVYDFTLIDLADRTDLHGTFDVVFDTSGALPVKTAMRLLSKADVFLDINATPTKFVHSALIRRHEIYFCTPTTKILTEVAATAVDGHLRASVGDTVPSRTPSA